MDWRASLARAEAWARRNPGKALAIGGGIAVAGGVLAGAGAAGVLPGQSGSIGNAPTLGSGALRSTTPSGYAAGKINTLLGWWSGALGTSIKRLAPLAWPGVPPEAFGGFVTNGAQRANTAMAPPYGVSNPFAELGWWGTEGGPRSTPPNAGPYPHPTSTSDNSWLALHADPLVKTLLGGRQATMVSGAWKEAIDDQTAIGLANLLRHRAGCNAAMPAACRSTDLASVWSVAVGFAAWSAGNAGMARWVARYQAALAAVPEARRFDAWIAAVVADARAGRIHGTGHANNPAHTAVRTAQKLYAGRLLAERTGGNVAWFPVISDRDQLILAAASVNAPLPA